MASLVLGPLLRYVDDSCATVWVETDEPCTVEVLGHRAPTFHVEGHHYALVVIGGLACGTTHPYTVTLDGEAVWPPPDSPFPPSTIRTLDPDRPIDLVFGSCRVTGPHEVLPTSARGFDRRGRDVDALRAYGVTMAGRPEAELPGALLLLGDQVYADEVSPATKDFIRERRGRRRKRGQAPLSGVADFEEYTRLYREAWSDPVVRWMLSTVPSAMIFDDHDVYDDWNTSQAWVEDMRRKPWWEARIVGGLMSYWLYQHLGNLSPGDLAENDLFAAVRSAEDGGPLLREFAHRADREAQGTRWSYRRDFGRSRLVVVDSRCGRVLQGQRKMLDDAEFDWLAEQTAGDLDHLLVATTLPYLLPRALHDLESWNEVISAGDRGRLAAWFGERLRRGFDLEHWAAFHASFERLTRVLGEAGSGTRGRAPASVVVLSGDVHHAYLSEVEYPEEAGVDSAVYQAVCSPMRHPMPQPMRWIYRAGTSAPAQRLTGMLARAAGVRPPSVRWRVVKGPRFENQIATLSLRRREAELRVDRAQLGDDGEPVLEPSFAHPLAGSKATATSGQV